MECGVSEMKDEYDYKNEVNNTENKQIEKKKSKTDVSLVVFIYKVTLNFFY